MGCASERVSPSIQITELVFLITSMATSVKKIKHLCSKTVFTNICESISCSDEISEFQPCAVIECHLCKKSSCESPFLSNGYRTRSVSCSLTPLSEETLTFFFNSVKTDHTRRGDPVAGSPQVLFFCLF